MVKEISDGGRGKKIFSAHGGTGLNKISVLGAMGEKMGEARTAHNVIM